jgi:predicted nucleotidyltransferase
MNEQDTHIAKLIRKEIKNLEPGAQIILFGSRARGDSKKDSDWDVLILTDSSDVYSVEISLRDKLFDLEIETGEVFSIFVYNKKDWNTRHKVTPLYHSISNEGIKL